ncbi:glutamine amidotransferase [Herminiimonas arsenitoxidans]|uniref:glutamine amidotransferase n=1 Tax=Herminiimonas arsenitoxidans TaxID=1809410 RepID=UPI000970F35C|nr:glutamine amidotransferase [Herminiimonas arsenitoxidans]
MKPLLIIKTGDTYPELAAEFGDYEHWINAGFGELNLPVQVIDPRHGGVLPSIDTIAGVVVTGSDSMVTDRAAWSEDVAAWLAQLVKHNTPVLGICFGHQLLAHALGGEVGFHPQGLELGSVDIQKTPSAASDILFKDLPMKFAAQEAHRQCVQKLPPNAVLLASNEFELHQAYRVGAYAWGVQFHPEFNREIAQRYIQRLATSLSKDAALMPQAVESTEAASLLKTFGTIVKNQQDLLYRCAAPMHVG